MRRARPRPLCVLPSRALAVLLLATSVVPLPERRWWCPLPGQRHSASAVGPAQERHGHEPSALALEIKAQ